MLDEVGRWHSNTTCKICRCRHPFDWTCDRAERLARRQTDAVSARSDSDSQHPESVIEENILGLTAEIKSLTARVIKLEKKA